MSVYWPEFGKIALVHLLAVASPGPDFAIVLRQAVSYGRRTAFWTALGVSTPICVHLSYSLFGLAIVLHRWPAAYTVVKLAGAAYLGWIGWRNLRARPASDPARAARAVPAPPSARSAWRTGVFTNALNPKVPLFFFAVFATLVSPATPTLIRAGYGAWMSLATTIWFCVVAYLFTGQRVRAGFLRCGLWIDRGLGVLFLFFAVCLAISQPALPVSRALPRSTASLSP
jgi:RhtB (resistance to homoserine/threonine) family protein